LKFQILSFVYAYRWLFIFNIVLPKDAWFYSSESLCTGKCSLVQECYVEKTKITLISTSLILLI